jgi:hypothetical protein
MKIISSRLVLNFHILSFALTMRDSVSSHDAAV